MSSAGGETRGDDVPRQYTNPEQVDLGMATAERVEEGFDAFAFDRYFRLLSVGFTYS